MPGRGRAWKAKAVEAALRGEVECAGCHEFFTPDACGPSYGKNGLIWVKDGQLCAKCWDDVFDDPSNFDLANILQ